MSRVGSPESSVCATCLRLLRAEVWRQLTQRSSVTSRIVSAALHSPAVLAHRAFDRRFSDSHRLHEELITAGGIIQEAARTLERDSNSEVLQPRQSRAAGVNSPSMTSLPQLSRSLLSALDARGRDRTDSIADN